jgi:ABC-type dipeptide/oligopeptide/nickel transport system permease subunit
MSRHGRVGALLLIGLAVFALIGPVLAPDPTAQDLATGTLMAPSAAHWFGTDQLARDMFARLAYGARVSLSIAAIAIVIAATIGSALGLAAGALDGFAGRVVSRGIDLGLELPRVIVLLVVLAGLGQLATPWLGVVLGATGWAAVARLVRGETLRLRHAQYVTAAHALGAPRVRVVWRDIFPGTIPAVLVAMSLGVADVILLEAGLSFIGVGVRPPAPSWGGMILDARDYLSNAPWLLIAPCVALVAATSAATLLGDALRRTLQPESK